MWQWNVLWSVFPPGPGRFGQRRLAAAGEKMTLRILTDEQRQLNPRQLGQQMIEPQRRALTAWRHVAAVASPRITIAHGNDGDTRLIIKDILFHAHPGAQTLTTGVTPRNAGRVHADAGRLSNDENTSRLTGTQHRARAERQMRFAGAAVAHSRQQRIERAIVCLGHGDLLAHGKAKTIPDVELDAEKTGGLEYSIMSPLPNDTPNAIGSTALLSDALILERQNATGQDMRCDLNRCQQWAFVT